MNLVQTISALVLVFGLLGVLYWLSNRYSSKISGLSNRQIKIKEKIPLGDRRSILLVEVAQKCYLIGSTTHSISLLAPLELDPEPAESKAEKSEEKVNDKGAAFRKVLEMIR